MDFIKAYGGRGPKLCLLQGLVMGRSSLVSRIGDMAAEGLKGYTLRHSYEAGFNVINGEGHGVEGVHMEKAY